MANRLINIYFTIVGSSLNECFLCGIFWSHSIDEKLLKLNKGVRLEIILSHMIKIINIILTIVPLCCVFCTAE